MPADDEAYHRLHAILTRRDDADGLDRLLSYKLQQTSDPAARVRLYLDRARLRLDGTGNRKGAIEDLRRILQLDPEHAESLRRLGRLAVEDRRFAVAGALPGAGAGPRVRRGDQGVPAPAAGRGPRRRRRSGPRHRRADRGDRGPPRRRRGRASA
jgi:hypothetical protein